MSDRALLTRREPVSGISRPTMVAGAIFVVAVALRLYRLGTIPLWTDELFTAFYPKAGLSYLWTEGLRTEPTSPLYYSLIGLIEQVAGQGAWTLRLLSVVGSLLGIGAGAWLAWELFGRGVGVAIAALLLTLAPTDIFYAQEARSYALQGAALGFALLGFARVLAGRRGLVLYATAATLAIWLHPTSIVAVAAINVAALVSVVGRSRLLAPGAFLRWCGASAVVAILSTPLLPVLLSPTSAAATGWIPRLTRWSLEGLIGDALAGPALPEHAMQIGEAGVVLLLLLFVLPLWRPGRRAATVLLLAPGLCLAVMIGISLVKPILLTRTAAWLLIPLAAALGDVLARRPRPVAIAVVALVAVSTLFYLARIDTLKEDWRAFLGRLPNLAPPTLVVLAPHTSPAALALYAPNAGPPVRLDDAGPPVPETTVIPRVLGVHTITDADLKAAIEAGHPVWLLYRRPEYEWMVKITAGLPPPQIAVQDTAGSNPGIRALFW